MSNVHVKFRCLHSSCKIFGSINYKDLGPVSQNQFKLQNNEHNQILIVVVIPLVKRAPELKHSQLVLIVTGPLQMFPKRSPIYN
jgi:hypothetical protein